MDWVRLAEFDRLSQIDWVRMTESDWLSQIDWVSSINLTKYQKLHGYPFGFVHELLCDSNCNSQHEKPRNDIGIRFVLVLLVTFKKMSWIGRGWCAPYVGVIMSFGWVWNDQKFQLECANNLWRKTFFWRVVNGHLTNQKKCQSWTKLWRQIGKRGVTLFWDRKFSKGWKP